MICSLMLVNPEPLAVCVCHSVCACSDNVLTEMLKNAELADYCVNCVNQKFKSENRSVAQKAQSRLPQPSVIFFPQIL